MPAGELGLDFASSFQVRRGGFWPGPRLHPVAGGESLCGLLLILKFTVGSGMGFQPDPLLLWGDQRCLAGVP